MRPASIILFDRLFLASLALVLIDAILTFDARVAEVMSDPAAAQIGWGSGFVATVIAVSLLVPLLLWYLIAYRASSIAKWLLVIIVALGLPFIKFDPANLLAMNSLMTLLSTGLQLVAIVMLFRRDAVDWMAGGDDGDEGDGGGVTLR